MEIATSIPQIADAVGIRKASLYSCFEKETILDALVQEVLNRYAEHSIFAGTDWEKASTNSPLTSEAVVQMIGTENADD